MGKGTNVAASVDDTVSEKSKSASPDSPNISKLYIRGTVSNGLAFGTLAGIGYALNVEVYVAVALLMQLAVFFLHGLPQSSEKFYDLSGSFTHFAVVLTCLITERRARSPRQLFVAAASLVWMTRLGTFLYNRILKDGKDERFDAIKPVWLSFMGAWSIQAVWVTLIQLPVVLLNTTDDTASTSFLDVVAMLLWVVGFLCEAAADCEKMAFRSDPANRHKFITTGLWSLSRHPNYFGEILMWCSMALIGTSAAVNLGNYALLGSWISPAFTALLLLKVSGVPMVEKAGEKKWGQDPEYIKYMKETPCIIPKLSATEAPSGKKKKTK